MANINFDKLSKTLGLSYKTEHDRVFTKNGEHVLSYVFHLGDDKKEKVCSLWFSEDRLNEINLTIIAKNEYRSSICFSNITKVVYVPKYRAVRFESYTKTHISTLKVYWRGQFDLTSYFKSVGKYVKDSKSIKS
ncbi:MAG: hypothetical protein UU32_C0044G0002 [Candidatus Woesebacteria bacterium GW2011_GWB1_41_10]|uniref:Uncharacterized protein n=1 Tax=Candidatus Woesebacteria bacterium GW2011_GWB1_41_10 TaxID=1618577 RepID=A0A0G0WJS0_9BACT|nr:MAG: hypothetical protein UU32_C0044G0002 [Candidatus Woesebacteria bacterium GW2011_GWB1_41_10]